MTFQFRPCIDLRNGKVTQIVGSTLQTQSDQQTSQHSTQAVENFVSEKPSEWYADFYHKHNLTGGHVIMLGSNDANNRAGRAALNQWRNGMQIGGGITLANAQQWIDEGAAAVIVTSYLFDDGKLMVNKLIDLANVVGRDRIVVDLSCRRKKQASSEAMTDEDKKAFYVVTNQWQTYSQARVDSDLIAQLSPYCSEFLIHGVDVEGKRQGIEEDLLQLLATIVENQGTDQPLVFTYAGGVRNLDDVRRVKELGHARINVSIGSALDIFGGDLSFDSVVEFCKA